MVATLQCPCGERDLIPAARYDAPPAGETRFDLGAHAYCREYRACAICDHWFARHALDLSTIYDQPYVDATYGGADGMRRKFEAVMALPPEQSDNRGRVNRVRRFARAHGIDEASGPTLLDIGAGLGVFPAAMAQAGWRATGLDLDPRTVAHLREVARVGALAVPVEQLDPAAHGTFQAITFNKVLEHVHDPVAMLSAALTCLAQGGFVYVEVPDVAAAGEGTDREEFFIEHAHVFSPASLAMTGRRAGLATRVLERLREPSGKYTLRLFGVREPCRPR